MTVNSDPQYLTIHEASEILLVHKATIRRWIASGRLPAYRVGRMIRIKTADLDNLGTRIPSA